MQRILWPIDAYSMFDSILDCSPQQNCSPNLIACVDCIWHLHCIDHSTEYLDLAAHQARPTVHNGVAMYISVYLLTVQWSVPASIAANIGLTRTCTVVHEQFEYTVVRTVTRHLVNSEMKFLATAVMQLEKNIFNENSQNCFLNVTIHIIKKH